MHASADIAENSEKAKVTISNKRTQKKAKGKVVYFISQRMSIIIEWVTLQKRLGHAQIKRFTKDYHININYVVYDVLQLANSNPRKGENGWIG